MKQGKVLSFTFLYITTATNTIINLQTYIKPSRQQEKTHTEKIRSKSKARMKITVMTADEQILSLDVDPHETVEYPFIPSLYLF